MILRMMNDAVSGNAKAQSNVIALARSLGLIETPGRNTEPITTDDLAMMVDFSGAMGTKLSPCNRLTAQTSRRRQRRSL